MGLLDGLGNVIGDVVGGRQINLLQVAEQVFNNAGGVNGIVAQLNAAGLGEQVNSWIGTGQNLPVSAEQIEAALSSDQLKALAQSFGVDLGQVTQLLADHLPKAVDAASPAGTLPS